MSIIKLKSSDGDIFDVEVEIAKKSGLIKEMIENLGMKDDDQEPSQLTNVNSPILRKVLEWATFHRDDPPPPEEYDTEGKRILNMCAWDMEFLKVDQGTLFELILAANYLDIKGLFDATCKTVADMMRGCKTPEEFHKIFNIKDDFSRSEEQLEKENEQCDEKEEPVRKENKWCEEKEQVQKEKVSGVKKKSDYKIEMSGVKKKKGH